jgi:hypothetical protein
MSAMAISVAIVAMFCRFKLNFLPLKKYALKQDILIPVLQATHANLQFFIPEQSFTIPASRVAKIAKEIFASSDMELSSK